MKDCINVVSLEMRRLRSDLILVFKIVKSFVKVVAGKFSESLDRTAG